MILRTIKMKHLPIIITFILLNTPEYVLKLIGCPRGVYVFCHVPYADWILIGYMIVFAIFIVLCSKYLFRLILRFKQKLKGLIGE